ncbi:MAG: hypothetical protein NC038_07805 [Paludibacter sp.]|nr:hypothetical protein [Prevotella sp.]MCM1443647.1 hypothetical protein [Muribaculum sp.]MCM1482522.1 hypothetical protein [Paludibacter sp.]MCM1576898.1 hypothetical protein [Bacteroides sp.]
MSKGLKIYACSGLGIGTAQQDFQYWRDNTVTINNTRAVNNLLAEINAISATLQYGEQLSESEMLGMLNMIDLYVICLQAAKSYKCSELQRFGNIIAKYVEEGKFDYSSTDDAERDTHLDDLYTEIETLFLTAQNYDVVSAFNEWFNTNVVAENYNGYTPEEQKAAAKAIENISKDAVSGTSNDASEYLFNCGGYYLYQFMDEKEAKKLPYVIYKKWKKEGEVLKYVHGEYDKLMSPDAVDKIIYSGVCSQYKHTPEYIIGELTGKKEKGIGITAELLTAIAAFITAIVTAITMLLTFVAQVVQAKYAEPENPQSGTPEDTDWGEDEWGSSNSKWMKYGLIGVAAWFLISKFKK